jgi:hypothetical protein
MDQIVEYEARVFAYVGDSVKARYTNAPVTHAHGTHAHSNSYHYGVEEISRVCEYLEVARTRTVTVVPKTTTRGIRLRETT